MDDATLRLTASGTLFADEISRTAVALNSPQPAVDRHPMAETMRIRLRLGSSFLCAAVAVGCGGGSKSTPGGSAPAAAVVGKSGGAVSSMDGNVGVTIPAGALGTDVTITVAPAEAPASAQSGSVYEESGRPERSSRCRSP